MAITLRVNDSNEPVRHHHLMIKEYIGQQARADAAWEEWHMWQFLRWTGWAWHESLLRTITLAVNSQVSSQER